MVFFDHAEMAHPVYIQLLFPCLISVIILGFSPRTEAMTSTELSLFSVTGSYDATVSVDDSTYNHKYIISASGMPDHAWQQVNPNTPTPQNYALHILKTPEVESTPGCLPMGMIGVTRTGVAIYNPLTAENYNAVEGSKAETFDNCDGHATNTGSYHYHKIPDSCLYNGGTDEFIGVAMDGFPIYGPKASWKGSDVTTADLDQCHGYNVSGEYRYYVTADWPYYLACYKGKVIHQSIQTTYDCTATSTFDGSWGYLCSCKDASSAGILKATYCLPCIIFLLIVGLQSKF